LVVPSSIGFAQWIVEDDERRAKGLEQARRDMELVAAIGGQRLACPPSGGTDKPGMSILKAAERYRALVDAGEQIGVLAQLELWGFSKNFHRLGECVAIAIESGHPKACVLLDVFHLYTGGTEINGIGLLNGNTVHTLHMNDYPADPPREKINDSFRCFPGDGTAPIVEILRKLRAIGGEKALSLELFSQKYWTMDPFEVATTGLEKMKAVVEKALAGA
jgi:sugar phosphate isomerase/epimerase